MLSRNLMLGLGVLALLAGVMLAVLWFHRSAAPAPSAVKQIPMETILVATHPIAIGSLLRPGDMTWGEVPAAEVVGADIVQGSVAETVFVGAVTRRAFATREPLTDATLVKPGDRDFLIAALAPGYRAVSIGVDAAQSTSGLVLPGDHVDIVLTQSFQSQGSDAGHKSVGETVLHDLRVIAVDQTLSSAAKPAATTTLSDPKMPKTITLEVTEHQAQMLLVAEQLGKIQLALLGQQDQDAAPHATPDGPPTWASDVSPALAGPAATANGPIEVIHGAKTERRCETSAGLITCP